MPLQDLGDEREMMWVVAGDPKRSWLAAYVNYARTITDAPLAFHVGAGLAALAAAVGSNLSWTGGGGRENWPNLYVLLLAPSGIYRKSTSVDLAASLLARATSGRIMDREFSPEQFVVNLSKSPASMLKEAEFSSLLMRMERAYMAGLKALITELYDSVQEYGRGTRGNGGERNVIVRPALTILAASTTDWLVSSVTEVDLRSGFLPRFLQISSSSREPEPAGGYWAERDPHAEEFLVHWLREIASRPPAHLVVREVKDYLIRWDAEARAWFESGKVSEDMSGIYSRLAHTTAKLCALLTIAESDATSEYVVNQAVAFRATGFMDWAIARMAKTFEQNLVFDKVERVAQRVLMLLTPEGTDQRFILRSTHLSARDLEGVLDTLKGRGEVDVVNVTDKDMRRRTMVRLVPGGGD